MIDAFANLSRWQLLFSFKSALRIAFAIESGFLEFKAIIERARLENVWFCIISYMLYMESEAQFSVLQNKLSCDYANQSVSDHRGVSWANAER